MQVPAAFEYARASTVDEAIRLLTELGPEARLLAGGHSLLPMMKLRLAAPEHLIDIDELAGELGYIRESDDEVRIGAMTRHRELLESELVASRLAIFTDAERLIADPLVRNRGTVGGALCQADPAEDLSTVCAALGGTVVVRSAGGERVLSMRDFHTGPYETAVGEGEIMIEVRIPLRADSGSAYQKVKRRAGDWAVAGSAVAVTITGGTIERAGIALTAVGADDTCERAEQALVGQAPTEEAFAAAGRLAAEDCAPVTDQRGSAAYKRHLANELTLRALRSATARAIRGEEDA